MCIRDSCQTGFYLVVRDVEPGKVFEITKEVLKQILEYDGPVFGASAIECGHCLLYTSDLEVHLPMSSYFYFYNRIVDCNGEHRL